MRLAVPQRLRSRKVLIPLLVLLIVVVAGVVVGVSRAANGYRTVSKFITGTPEPDGTKVQLDTTVYLPDSGANPAAAVLLAQGFGGSKSGLAGDAKTLAEHGYVALAYTARGFGESGGLIHLDSPDYEVHDGTLLIDYLISLKQVDKTKIAVAGGSYGGALSLLLAGYDQRVKAVAADITWNDLSRALFPNADGSGPGVFKKFWAGTLFGNAFSPSVGSSVGDAFGGGSKDGSANAGTVSCGRFALDVCAAYQHASATGQPNAAILKLLRTNSPARVLAKIKAPTLLTQGEQDSLFPLSEVDANAKGIAANGTPVRVVWRRGGHDDSGGEDVVSAARLSWFGAVFGGGVGTKQPFQFSEQGALLSSSSGRLRQQVREAPAYPGIGAAQQDTTTMTLVAPPQTIAAPAGGAPAAITAVPGLSGLLSSFGSLSSATSALSAVPSQTAIFVSPKLGKSLLIVGSSTVTVTVTTKSTTDATLFLALRDVASDGTNVLPAQLVAPLHLSGLRPGQPRSVTVHLPSVVRTVPAGHRIVLTVATTDFAYELPQDPRTYTVSLGNTGTTTLTVPTTTSGKVLKAGHPLAWLIAGLVIALATALGVGFVIRRRRRVLKSRPDLAHVPVSVESLVKEYAGGYRAVDDVSFRVERGQVVGLLGPNGAGKTTALRVLVGLITPTSGAVHVFGEPIVPGAPVLARLGAFIEGPGFLPHLSGRENLRLYWAATGRPADEADFDTALEIAGLGPSIDRRVRAYSHGMRQRLGIAQSMLGLPELLVLDEPTNGLDPPQIAEMREVMKRYAETGRTVVVSSHLLAEVEQTCTHVVVMHKGKLVAAGSVAEIAGAGGGGVQLAVADPERAAAVLAGAGIRSSLVPARRALEDVFLGLIEGDE